MQILKPLTQVVKAPWYAIKRMNTWQRIVGAFVLLVTLQLLIPTGLIAYNSTLDGKSVQFKTKESVRNDLQNKAEKITIAFGDKQVNLKSQQTGISIRSNQTIEQLESVTLVDKLIPFGPAVKVLRTKQVQTIATKNQVLLKESASSLAKKYSQSPQDATAAISPAGELKITTAKAGLRYTDESVLKAIGAVKPYDTEPVKPKATTVESAIQTSNFKSAEKQLKSVTTKKLTLNYGDKAKSYDVAAFSSWLEITQQEDKTFALHFKDVALQEQLDVLAKEYNVSAGTTQVTTVDGNETARTTGTSGRSLDIAATKAALQAWLVEPSDEAIAAKTATTAPRVIITKVYSASSAGLQNKINAWVAANGGSGKYQVAVQELGGQGRVASVNVSQQTVMASTYKLFLAFAAYKQSENGALSLSTQLSCGKNIQQSIEVMIVNSDNDCAGALGRYIGWVKVDQIIAANGFRNVTLNNYDAAGNVNGDKMVNAGELAKFLTQLSSTSLINGTNTNTLLGYMKRQVYREGIPAGSRGAIVADKVGFLEGYLHDAGIVYSKKTTYAVVIMSSGSSWKNIANLSTAIYDFMNE